jgi:hypothetical protein
MEMPIGNQLLTKIESYDLKNPNKIQFEDIKQQLLNCINDVEKYTDRYSHWTDDYLVQWLYKPRHFIEQQRDIETYNKIHLVVAIRSFKKLVVDIEYKNFELFVQHIRCYIIDLKFFIEFFENKTNSDYSFLIGGKSYYTDSHSIKLASNNLFWQSPINTIEHQKIAFILSIMALRQSIEMRLKRICGIERVYPKSGEYISSNFFPDFINQHPEYFEFPPNWNFSHILKVYKWTHNIVHNGVQPLVWEVSFALDYTRILFGGGSITTTDQSITKESIYGAVKVKKYCEMKEKISQKISDYFKLSLEDIDIIWAKLEAIDKDEFMEKYEIN